MSLDLQNSIAAIKAWDIKQHNASVMRICNPQIHFKHTMCREL